MTGRTSRAAAARSSSSRTPAARTSTSTSRSRRSSRSSPTACSPARRPSSPRCRCSRRWRRAARAPRANGEGASRRAEGWRRARGAAYGGVMDVLVLSRAEVERLLDLGELLDALRDAFRALSSDRVSAPGRNELAGEGDGFLLGMPGRSADGPMVVKLVTVFESNLAAGLPSHLATVAVHDAATGACRAFVDGTYITAVRTSAAAAVACDTLARGDARTLAIVGAGVQGEQHLRTFPLVRSFDDIRIASRHLEDAERLAAADPRARAVPAIRDAVAGADVVALARHAAAPVVEPGWIAPGAHVSSVGYRPPAGELH